jgi:microsomal dipeptidase-like Zn-dependent dipeptidase
VAFGGKLFYGGADVGVLLPADPDCNQDARASSERQALGHDKSTHGGYGLFDNRCGDDFRGGGPLTGDGVIHELQRANNAADPSGDASGYPDFPDWPKWDDITHQHMWVEWLRRAYDGGLRVLVALAVNNKTLADMTRGPGDTLPDDDKSSADLQIGEIKQFAARHPDFMVIAYSSADVQRIVASNKLAVVIGIEIDHIGNFQTATWLDGIPLATLPSDAMVAAEIDRLYGEGVRYVFPIHVLDNAFGGTAVYIDLFNVSNLRESGHPWQLTCSDPADAITHQYDPGSFDWTKTIGEMAKLGMAFLPGPGPQCPQNIGHRNKLGLTASGVVAIKEMMRLGMLIDIDHMSQGAVDQTLDLAEQVPGGYPLNSGHNGLRGASPGSDSERALTSRQYQRIGKLHGMAGVGGAGLDAWQWLALYGNVVTALGGDAVVGFGTDTNGLALGMRPRLGERDVVQQIPNPQYQPCLKQCADDCPDRAGGNRACIAKCEASCKASFPPTQRSVCVSECGTRPSSIQYSSDFPAPTDGTRTWNYNSDGVAHYGMLWDFLRDVATLDGGAAAVDRMMNGAQYFFETWQIAERRAATMAGGSVSGTCSPGLTQCNGTCVNSRTDRNNCGACGNACDGRCVDGKCVTGCPPGTTACCGGDVCVQTGHRCPTCP